MESKKNLPIALTALLILALVVISILVYPRLKTPSTLKQGSFKTEIVERGEVVSIIEATGVVESENEVLIHSPARSLIKKI